MSAIHMPTLVKKYTYLEEIPGCTDDTCNCTVWKGHCPLGDCFIVNGDNQKMQFSIKPFKHRIFYCFGCQRGGDLISFIGALLDKSVLNSIDILIEEIEDEQQKRDLRRVFEEDYTAFRRAEREDKERRKRKLSNKQKCSSGDANSQADSTILE